jgi:hypothetical protein
MRIIKPITEPEVVAEFLRAEYFSPRFSDPIRSYLYSEGLSDQIILEPNLEIESQNNHRAKILNAARGYLDRKPGNVFHRFPDEVQWSWAQVSAEELSELYMPNHPAWMQITDNTRLLSVGAEYLMSSDPMGNPARFVRDFMSTFDSSAAYPPIIVVGRQIGSRLVVLEGSVRAISYWLLKDKINQVDLVIGLSPRMDEYDDCLTDNK